MFYKKGIFFIVLMGSIPFFYTFTFANCVSIEFQGKGDACSTIFNNYILDACNGHLINKDPLSNYISDFWYNYHKIVRDNDGNILFESDISYCGGVSIQDDNGCCEDTCPDDQKLCEWLRVVDSNNNIVKAGYVTYENRNANLTEVPSLNYVSPSYNFAAEGNTAYISLSPKICMCPDDSDLPSDLQNNFSITPGDVAKAPDTTDNFDCAQKCFPRSYLYTDNQCICVDNDSNTDVASTPPGSPTDESPASAPTDSTDSAQQLGAVNENLGSIINQGNQSNNYLSNIADNLASSVNNQQGIVDGIGNLGNQIGSNISGLGDKIDAIQDQQSQGYNLEGTADLPTENDYDPVVDDVEEDSLTDAITGYISSGIPILSYINGSGAVISGASSSMDVSIWGGTVNFDLSPMAGILDTMGYFLTAISMIVGFFIIVGRG